jgi:chemotaxis protein histidine kinase CheA
MGLNHSPPGSDARPDARAGASAAQLDEARAALRMRFVVLVPRKVEALREALRGAERDEGARRELQRLGHQLKGTAATVGFADVGALAGVIERAASSDYDAAAQERATSAVALLELFVSRARLDAASASVSDDPRYAALLRALP